MNTVYQPEEVEEKWYSYWEKQGYFAPQINEQKKSYTIVIPPPNITGILHMGHALNNIIQDILIRWKRMAGFPTLWLPGTDHAGIATQNVVEKKLLKKGIKKENLGREEFINEIWKWKEKHGLTIINQLKKLGCSCDWSRERWTMDEGLSDAVQEVFIKLYEQGFIYRGNYIVNWCPHCQTALSDEEVEHQEIEGKLYYIKYPLKSVNRLSNEQVSQFKQINYIIVATTRPETMLGDVAIAVHPKDKRYKSLIGQRAILPILDREIAIISDTIVDPDFGTGAVKITPYHDANDFEVSQRKGLKGILVINTDGTMNEHAGKYKGMDRLKCRDTILKDLKKEGFLIKTESHRHSIGRCYRCETTIEPYLSRQWFVKMKPLAKKAIEVVKNREIKFYPSRWTKVYLNWMKNIRDWCISRQIWWGHRLPVYYCRKCQGAMDNRKAQESKKRLERNDEQNGIIVSKTKPKKCPYCNSTEIYQDEDVLDTWFSSWLWPFSTLGWPDEQSIVNSDLNYFYPTSTLVTAPEIIFFWVARMIIAGIKFTKKIPFKDVYIHGTVRDSSGKKMSKSLGNTIDPLETIKKFGADALRFSIVFISPTGQDIFLSKQKFTIGRNFANKIWNASRYILQQPTNNLSANNLELKEKWILSRLNQTIKEISKSLENYRFQDAESKIYEFFWHQFCDWYIELAKLSQPANRQTIQTVLYHILEISMRLVHPFMPFISEEIWQKIKTVNCLPRRTSILSKQSLVNSRGTLPASIMIAPWPEANEKLIDKKSEENMELFIEIVKAVRNLRAELNIRNFKGVSLILVHFPERLKEYSNYIFQLTHIENIIYQDKKPTKAISTVVQKTELYLILKELDFAKEKKRLQKKTDELSKEIDILLQRLKDKDFLKKAPSDVIQKTQKRKKELENKRGKILAMIM